MRTYCKSAVAVLFFFVISTGCARQVRYRVSQDFTKAGPSTVAVLPAGGAVLDAGIKEVFRNAAIKRLRAMNYGVVSLEDVDAALAGSAGSGQVEARTKEILGLLNADSLLYINIRGWDEDLFLTYASLTIRAEFVLYSREGAVLWHATYGTKESEMRFDKELLSMGVLKTYEPRIERLVDTVFTTLPPRSAEKKEEGRKKRYFDWL